MVRWSLLHIVIMGLNDFDIFLFFDFHTLLFFKTTTQLISDHQLLLNNNYTIVTHIFFSKSHCNNVYCILHMAFINLNENFY